MGKKPAYVMFQKCCQFYMSRNAKKCIEIIRIISIKDSNFAFQKRLQKCIFSLQELQMITVISPISWVFFLVQQNKCKTCRKSTNHRNCIWIIAKSKEKYLWIHIR